MASQAISIFLQCIFLLRPRSSQLNCVYANSVNKKADLAKGARTHFLEVKSSQSCVKWLCIIFLSLSSTLQCNFFSDVNRCNAALSRLPGNCYARRENLQPSSHQHSGGLGSPLQTAASLFASPKQAEVERSVSPVAELNAEMREGRLVRDVTSHRGGPAADLISSSWLQQREDADLITARLSPCCDALSRVHGSSSFFSSQF